MPFALDSHPEISEISEALNYLLGNFGANLSADPNTGEIKGPTGQVIAYLYKYLAVKYADSADGALNFGDTPTNRLYYGLRNSDQSVESTNPADYIWKQVAGGFGTTKFLWYQTGGGRQVEFVVADTSPSIGFLQPTLDAIDLDIITSTLATPAFLPFFQPAALQVVRSGTPLTPNFTGVVARLYATAGGVLATFVTSQTDTDPAFGLNTWRIGNSATTGYGDIAYNQITVGTPTDGGGYALWPAPTAMSGTPASLTVPVRFKNSLGAVSQSVPAIVQFVFVDQGASGDKIAYPSVYQWNTSIPTVTGTSTYTWASSTFTPNPAGWSDTPGVGPAGFTLYRAQVTLTALAGATTSTINWTTASVLGIGYSGDNGTSSRICFARIAGNPVPLSGTITTTGSSGFPTSGQSATTWGVTATWGAVDPNPSSTDSLYQSDGIYNPAINQTSWTTPYISSLKVGQLSAVSTNTGSLTISGTLQSNTALISGTTMTGSGGVLYSSGNFAFGNSTTNITYNGTALTMNGPVVAVDSLKNNTSGTFNTSGAFGLGIGSKIGLYEAAGAFSSSNATLGALVCANTGGGNSLGSGTTANICSFTGSISGTTLTVTSVASGTIHIDATVTGASTTSCNVTAFGTGTGGTGTYTVSVSQTSPSNTKTAISRGSAVVGVGSGNNTFSTFKHQGNLGAADSGGIFYTGGANNLGTPTAEIRLAYYNGTTSYAAYIVSGATFPFTAGHDALQLLTEDIPEIGDLMVDVDLIAAPNVNDCITSMTLSISENQKGVVGVFVGTAGNEFVPSALGMYTESSDGTNTLFVMKPEFTDIYETYRPIGINSIGEGKVNVCGQGGDIAIGDLICASDMAGKGMKQGDDLYHSYTVAKSRQAVTFSSPDEVVQIACIYVSG